MAMPNCIIPFLLTIAFFSGFGFKVTAQNNVLVADSSFNGIGHLLTDTYPQLYPMKIALQSDGKIIIVGEGNLLAPSPNLGGYVCRVNTNGTLDTSFADNGFYSIPFGLNNIFRIHVLPDDKILIHFGSLPFIYFIRLTSDGSLDASFGSDGIATHVSTSNYDQTSDMVVQPDQKILSISYHLSNYTVSVRRFYPDGILDETYGNQGVFHLDTSPFILNPIGHLQSDGKLVITGITGHYQLAGFVAVRLNENGGLDHTFSDDGIYSNIIGSQNTNVHGYALTINADGIIYIGGGAPLGANEATTIMSLNPDGTPNLNFGPKGVRQIFLGYYSDIRKILLQADGKILIVGRTKPNSTTEKFLIARYNTNGSLDSGFGNNGILELSPYSTDYKFRWFTDAQFSSDGKLYCVGHLHETSNYFDNAQNSQILYRFIYDNAVKTEEPNPIVQHVKAIPSLVTNELSILLDYELRIDANINISLFDQNGIKIRALVPSSFRDEGKQVETIELPQGLNTGLYYIVISDGINYKPIKLMKL